MTSPLPRIQKEEEKASYVRVGKKEVKSQIGIDK